MVVVVCCSRHSDARGKTWHGRARRLSSCGAVNEEKVKLDANNVLAGQTITMRLEITDIEPGNR